MSDHSDYEKYGFPAVDVGHLYPKQIEAIERVGGMRAYEVAEKTLYDAGTDKATVGDINIRGVFYSAYKRMTWRRESGASPISGDDMWMPLESEDYTVIMSWEHFYGSRPASDNLGMREAAMMAVLRLPEVNGLLRGKDEKRSVYEVLGLTWGHAVHLCFEERKKGRSPKGGQELFDKMSEACWRGGGGGGIVI
ncbi:hypothetical protein LTR09_012107 [Extremus antarcticus]|uniref:Uncharacterized protein n=1 Tax=Extremus antarcticus TaxID=702011 RepID=A0AAJ0G9N7_9PEZI|nr:hypothetical protein LTR09_012107 [Extremus antarcticus]